MAAKKKAKSATSSKPKPKVKHLSHQQELFCHYKACGFNDTQAYMKAYGVPYTSALSNAYLVMGLHGVSEHIEELKRKTREALKLNREDLARHLLAAATTPAGQIGQDHPACEEVTLDEDGKVRIKIQGKNAAARLLCEMMGWKEPERHVVDAGPNTLEMVRLRAKQMASPFRRGEDPPV